MNQPIITGPKRTHESLVNAEGKRIALVEKCIDEFAPEINNFWKWQFRTNPNLKHLKYESPTIEIFDYVTKSKIDPKIATTSNSAILHTNEIFIEPREIIKNNETLSKLINGESSLRVSVIITLIHEYQHAIQGQIYNPFPKKEIREDQADYFTGLLISYFLRAGLISREEAKQAELELLTIGVLGPDIPGSGTDTSWTTCVRSQGGHATGQVRSNRFNQGYVIDESSIWPENLVTDSVNFGLNLENYNI